VTVSVIVDSAMRQIPRSTERISSLKLNFLQWHKAEEHSFATTGC